MPSIAGHAETADSGDSRRLRVSSLSQSAEAAPLAPYARAEVALRDQAVGVLASAERRSQRRAAGHGTCFLGEPMEPELMPMNSPQTHLVTPEVVQKIRSDNQLLLRTTQSMQASIETGRFDEAVPLAAELGKALRKQVLLVDGVLDVLTPDDASYTPERR